MSKIVSTGRTLFSEETYEKKKQERKRKMVLWSSLVLIVFVGLVLATRVSVVQIREIRVEGAQVITEEEVVRNVEDTLKGKYFLLVPKSNSLLYPGNEVRASLMREFPRFGAVELSLDGLQTLTIYVSERNPYALYCPSATRPQNALSCYFLDDTGFIFDEAPAFSGVVYFVYSSTPPIVEPKGQRFIEEGEFQNLKLFLTAVRDLRFEPVALDIGENESKMILMNGAYLLWNTHEDLNLLYQNLDAFLKSPTIQAEQDFLNNLSYLDLRTSNKIRWMLK